MKILILCGGDSPEREVSIRSAKNVQQALSKIPGNEVRLLDIKLFSEIHEDLFTEIEQSEGVVPMLHGGYGENGELAMFLETFNKKFTFSRMEAQKLSFDKLRTRALAIGMGIDVPKWVNPLCAEAPFFVKPVCGGSSIKSGIYSNSESYLKTNPDDEEMMAEELIKGREFTVGVLERGGEIFGLPVMEIVSKGFFDFEQKYDPNLQAKEIFPSDISAVIEPKLKSLAVHIHKAIGCRHASRSDFLLRDGRMYFLELNSIPGMTEGSLYPKMLKAAGHDLGEVFMDWLGHDSGL